MYRDLYVFLCGYIVGKKTYADYTSGGISRLRCCQTITIECLESTSKRSLARRKKLIRINYPTYANKNDRENHQRHERIVGVLLSVTLHSCKLYWQIYIIIVHEIWRHICTQMTPYNKAFGVWCIGLIKCKGNCLNFHYLMSAFYSQDKDVDWMSIRLYSRCCRAV